MVFVVNRTAGPPVILNPCELLSYYGNQIYGQGLNPGFACQQGGDPTVVTSVGLVQNQVRGPVCLPMLPRCEVPEGVYVSECVLGPDVWAG
jgi:hypothetical protein